MHVSYPHVHIVQIHRADKLQPLEGVVVLSNVNPDNLRPHTHTKAYARPYYCAFTKFNHGFLHIYGGFYSYTILLDCDKIVTFVQAYNSVAKMARAEPIGFFPLYLLCHGFQQFKDDKTLQTLAAITRSRIENLTDFVYIYCAQRVVYRLEEVLTIDVEKHANVELKIEQTGIFNENTRTILYQSLLGTDNSYQSTNWTTHVKRSIQTELAFLRHISAENLNLTYGIMPCTPRISLRTAVCAQYRLLFFAHGHDPALNYQLVQAMYRNKNENNSLDISGELIELDDYDFNDENVAVAAQTPCPFYNKIFPKEWTTVATFLYNIDIPLPSNVNEISQYILQLYATWAYVMHFLQPGARSDVHDIQPITANNALTLSSFFSRYAYRREHITQSPIRIKDTVTPD